MSLLLRGLYAKSKVVQAACVRIWDHIPKVNSTDIFTKDISYMDSVTMKKCVLTKGVRIRLRSSVL